MKTIALLVAFLAMVGFAAAWDTSDTLQYQFTHAMYQQAGDPTEGGFFSGVTSQSSFSANNPYGTGEGQVVNKLNYATTSQSYTYPYGTLDQPSQTLTLTQGGSATLATHALDSQDSTPEVIAGLSKYQDLHFSGVYSDVQANFADEGNVGLACNPIRVNENAYQTQNGEVYAPGATFTEADVGVASTSGLTWDKVTDQKTLSGSSQAFSSFTGGIAPAGTNINTYSGDFLTQTKWDNTAPVIPSQWP